ncbi:MAG: hypothetical protein ACI9KN_000720 [Gammaproteobacteria bacterium]|jgi:hypothetical protein
MCKTSSSLPVRIVLLILSALALSGCLLPSEYRHRPVVGDDQAIAVLDVSSIIQDQWEELQFKGSTEYRIVSSGAKPVIWASGRKSASGLIRFIELDASQCPTIEWSWRVDQLQADADLHHRSSEDVAASIYLLFGDPGLLSNPDLVPTLRYVWTNSKASENSVIHSPYLPNIVRSVIVRAGPAKPGRWLSESRNIAEDYQLAFGSAPPDKIQAVVLFTDNDQTEQPVESGYAWIRVTCQ